MQMMAFEKLKSLMLMAQKYGCNIVTCRFYECIGIFLVKYPCLYNLVGSFTSHHTPPPSPLPTGFCPPSKKIVSYVGYVETSSNVSIRKRDIWQSRQSDVINNVTVLFRLLTLILYP